MSFKKYIKHENGSAVLFLTIGMTSLCVLSAILLTASKLYIAKMQNTKNKSEQFSTNHFILNLLALKFKINDRKYPTWYPKRYPTAAEMIDKKFPLIEVLRKADPTRNSPLVSISRTINSNGTVITAEYDLDSSLMASVLKPNYISHGSPSFQTALVSTDNVKKVTTAQIGAFLTSPDMNWSGIGRNLLSEHLIEFMEYIPAYSNPSVLEYIKVRISNESEHISNIALLKVDTPPPPSCRIEISENNKMPLIAGNKVLFALKADSIVSEAKVNPHTSLDSSYSIVPKLLETQTIANLGNFVTVSEDFEVEIPATFKLKNLIVTANVSGVDNTYEPTVCSNSLALPDPPVCNSILVAGGKYSHYHRHVNDGARGEFWGDIVINSITDCKGNNFSFKGKWSHSKGSSEEDMEGRVDGNNFIMTRSKFQVWAATLQLGASQISGLWNNIVINNQHGDFYINLY